MSSHTRGPRSKRSRKTRPPAGRSAAAPVPAPAAPALPSRRNTGERPQAPWHPLPLSEVLILAGAIATAIGLSRGEGGVSLMLAGIGATALGTFEVTVREHRSGYRSHTILLSFMLVVAFHTAVVLVVSAFASFAPLLHIAVLAVDVALFLVLFRVLRARFLHARARRAAGR